MGKYLAFGIQDVAYLRFKVKFENPLRVEAFEARLRVRYVVTSLGDANLPRASVREKRLEVVKAVL